jgi:MoxR-like ATPase
MLINQADLNRYAAHGYNVLFEGKHGVGKTAVIDATFTSLNYRWKYFSAATLDPWVDLIGVPKAKTMKDGTEQLTLVRPDFIMEDNIDAIFFDELNRAPDKVLNAVMELIQFKSINGHKLKNLKVIWAAINPWDEENTYAVNEIDPALRDRFQVKIDVPYKVDEDWFKEQYPTTGHTFCSWWNSLEPDIKNLISPRRLAIAADAHSNGIKMTDILTSKSNIKKLKADLASLPFLKKIESLKTAASIKTFLSNINNVTELISLVKEQNPDAMAFLSKHKAQVPKEIIEASMAKTAGASPVKKLNHALTERAYETLLRSTFDNSRRVIEAEAAPLFKAEALYQIELLTNKNFKFFEILVEELRLYKKGSKAATDRVRALTECVVDYLQKASCDVINTFDLCLIGMLAAVITVDDKEYVTGQRAAFLERRLKKDQDTTTNSYALSQHLYNTAVQIT